MTGSWTVTEARREVPPADGNSARTYPSARQESPPLPARRHDPFLVVLGYLLSPFDKLTRLGHPRGASRRPCVAVVFIAVTSSSLWSTHGRGHPDVSKSFSVHARKLCRPVARRVASPVLGPLPFDHKRFEDARGASARSSGYALGAIEARHFSVVGRF